jgi:U3 small nucleolar RNA-associated protein MPP10
VKSTFESRQEALRRQIQLLEEANVAPKPWQLKGETKASDRPANSLLEEFLSYENLTKQRAFLTLILHTLLHSP